MKLSVNIYKWLNRSTDNDFETVKFFVQWSNVKEMSY